MKQLYSACCLALMLALPQSHKAQLNGIYTLDDTQLSSATNFTSFTQLATALNTSGISGPVTINVGNTSGPYVEQVQFLQITGTSATNTITINGNGRTITFGAGTTTLKATILLSGTDYLTINNLTVTASNATNAFAVHLWNGADNNNFNGCEFNSPLSGTGTGLCPFSISGSSVTVASSGQGGNDNTVNTCTANGGYYGVVFYSSSSINNTGNAVINSLVRDFYSTGIMNTYCHNTTIRGNVIERPQRTTVTTTEGIQISTGSENCLVERNHVRRLFDGLTSSSTGYGIYCSADATLGNENIIRNNLVSHMKSNGVQAGVYATSAEFAHIIHNTIVLDDATSTGGATYGIYITGPDNTVLNNLVYMTRGGTGVKNILDMTAAAQPGLVLNYNAYYLSPAAGTGNIADLGGTTYANLGAWQVATGYDLNSNYGDPSFANPTNYDYTPTNVLLNNTALAVGVANDFKLTPRSSWAPDPGAFEMFTSPCGGNPPVPVVSPTNVLMCPNNTVALSLDALHTFTNAGYLIQWQTSTVSVGGYTSVPGATINLIQTPSINVSTYYQVVVTCTNNMQTSTTLPSSITVMPTVVDAVPYFEGFEVLAQNGLPNCSWSSSSPGAATGASLTPGASNQVPRNGSGYAVFKSSSSGTHYFYTNQITMNAGITYSASLWYITDNFNLSNWTDLEILVGTSQSPTGLVSIASISPVTGQLYSNLSNTFTIPSSGLYYVAIKATTAAGTAPYLAWDDLSITIPCQLNSPALAVFTPTTVICEGQSLNITATGADTYIWNTTSTSSMIVVSPPQSTQYIVTGFNALSGCSASHTVAVTVNEAPNVVAFANHPEICAGGASTLTASGADTYFWTSGFNGKTTVVSPTATTNYSVSGTNSLGCSSTDGVQIIVHPLPTVNSGATSTVICKEDEVTLFANGAVTYQWMAPKLFESGEQINVIPGVTTNFTVVATDANGCQRTQQVLVVVEECTGLTGVTGAGGLKFYPNPAQQEVIVSGLNNNSSVTVADVSGRIIFKADTDHSEIKIGLGNTPAGLYIVTVRTAENNVVTGKFIKQ